MSATTAEKKFQEFDWSNSEWHKYFDALYPSPTLKLVDKYKRKWFKQNIDENLTLEVPTNTTNTSGSTETYHASQTPTKLSKVALISTIGCIYMLLVAMILSILCILPFKSQKLHSYAIFLYIIGFLINVFKTHGTPKLNGDYWYHVWQDDSAQNIFVTLPVLAMHSWLGLISPFITSTLILIDNSYIWFPYFPTIIKTNPTFTQSLESIKYNRYKIMQLRSNAEVFFGIASIFMAFYKIIKPLVVFFYWNMIRVKYYSDAFTQATFRQLDLYIIQVLKSPYAPSIILKTYETVKSFLQSSMRQSSQ